MQPSLSPLKAFSLIEVTLALGLAAFTMVSVMALIPIGLSTLGNAMDQTIETHILNGLAAKVGILSFRELDQLNGIAYFDIDGQPVEENSADVVYKATLSIVPVVYAGEPKEPEQTLQAVQVEMDNLRRSTAPSRTYTLHVAKAR